MVGALRFSNAALCSRPTKAIEWLNAMVGRHVGVDAVSFSSDVRPAIRLREQMTLHYTARAIPRGS